MSAITYWNFKHDFKVIKRIGQGNCATVDLVQHIQSKIEYALKTIPVKRPEDLAIYFNEVEIISAIQDQSIPKIEYFCTNEKPYPHLDVLFIMELCHGDLEGQIKRYRKQNKLFPIQEIYQFIGQMARVLYKLQIKDILHKDIKPANILIKNTPGNNQNDWKTYKLADFGYSTKINQYSSDSIAGTYQYASPRVRVKFENQKIHIEGIKAKDDIYSLGKTILNMIFLIPIKNEDINQKLYSKISQKYDNENLIGILRGILQYQERYRWDFVQFTNYLDKEKEHNEYLKDIIFPVSSQKVASTTDRSTGSKNMDEIKNSNQLVYQSMKNRMVKLQWNLGSLKQLKRQLTGTGVIENPINCDEEEKEIDNKKRRFEKKKTIHFPQKSFCVKKIDKYLIIGLTDSIGVIPISTIEKDETKLLVLELCTLNPQNFIFEDLNRFPVLQIKITESQIILSGHQKFILIKKKEDFLQNISQILESPEKFILLGRMKVERRPSKNIFGIQKNFPALYTFNNYDFERCYTQKCISCFDIREISDPVRNSKTSRIFLGHQNGSISEYKKKCVQFQNKQILKLIINQTCVVFSTFEGQVRKTSLQWFDSELNSKQTKPAVYKFSAGSPLIYINFVEKGSSSLKKSGELTPFLEMLTFNGFYIVVNSVMEQISSIRIADSSCKLIDICESDIFWEPQKVENQKINVLEGKKSEQKHLYCISDNGKLHNVRKQEIILNSGIRDMSTLYLDQQLLLINGRETGVMIYKKQ